ncbi:hypothetical protein IB276_33045 [Ensifer sp. ENS04]|uniref:hypothetical protein n=1 Tax=Ensifer sp. ENS04 TaxID=2769281 RepID=UPI001783ABB8|nr:hypothetical protein [Ensifer sp. ENS04]MBD9544274.1 hypothetical protein [Ensifer sp. ENS04]
MFHNTFEHGYSDAVCGKQRVLGSDEYHAGYAKGVRYAKSQRAIELAALGIFALTIGIVALKWVASSVRLPV